MSEQLIRPYGDTMDDGIMQFSFTLPVKHSARATKAASLYLAKLNLEEISIVHSHAVADDFTYFVAFAKAKPTLDYSKVEAKEVASDVLDFYEINSLIKTKINRPIVVVGATIGTDAHTVGIDAIMNMKGYNQNYGLERYPEIEAFNLGAQVTSEHLFSQAKEVKADVILVSQTVTQKDAHIKNFTEFIELLEAEGMRDKYIVLAGGPRITHELAIELGYDAGFGPGTLPTHVATYVTKQLMKKLGV